MRASSRVLGKAALLRHIGECAFSHVEHQHYPPMIVEQVVRETTRQKAEEAVIMLQVEETEALRIQKQKEGVSLAKLIEEKNKAEAVRVMSEVQLMSKKDSMRTMAEVQHFISTA